LPKYIVCIAPFTGECELADGGQVSGIAVHLGARIAGLAGASEILVSSTVKDLVAGAGLSFEDRGEHGLRGVPDRWHL
jgi:class 3 adenylate cyclase